MRCYQTAPEPHRGNNLLRPLQRRSGPLAEDPAGTIRFRAALLVPPPTVPGKAVFRHDGE